MGVKGQGAHIYVYVGLRAQSEDFKQFEDKKTLPLGSVLMSEEMRFDQSHPGSGPRKNPSSTRQGRGQKVWYAIKSDIPNHSMEDDKY